ncbi:MULTISPECIES: phospho-N-acetylmuramoyl-pentapeptide-transferase [Erysipelothrix]|uniref:Phospho-N-acetylmuramoyl-pentapeptide-transferase n=1 Tax=Erysipelothrix piscisicarius TaxID=2485784 RepID=A0A3Q8S325_9FIRM|nr:MULTISPECIES: phospho-N-acetylmuramoyl-pentapeptide-transferase [Erysipelothrix]AZK44534.1 phospho-N-acetylmuramoyl-pentapeptide-transferase [Erysipelothrix piscisicarius]MBK2401828.1 phospho-N-acetylmuramoyl-pentapeptide-transferase [Erysipelothrix sp. strain 2 (EsS2-6-Brazil)]MBK2404032.1 phospho-N-acetylmuramoyl-pentapeptide-transferase [Erysipelothrix sp. strain 2 (EsS2-7-Brazil)]NBA00916.1 phospho-N-acetylmuramoyl-pentapeptide-transferase [Erysipelothrix rhusiopathiae]
MIVGIIAMLTAFALSVVAYPRFIKYLQTSNMEQKVSEYALEEFKNKQKTPTFGGFIFVVVSVLVALVFNGFNFNGSVLLLIGVYAMYALIGLIDDYKIVKEGKNDGLSPKVKMFSQLLLAVLFYVIYIKMGGDNKLALPFMKEPIDLGWFYLPLLMFIFAGASNAVNLTDGMDGLAGGTSVIAFAAFAFVAYTLNRMDVFMVLLAVIGGLLGFLVYNRKPAKIIMGDVGSLALGALFAGVSVLLNKEILLAIVGGVFVFETLCVIIQRTSWKLRHKKVFKYTPIHYSFTLNGWKEENVVNFFYALGVAFAIIGLALNAIA